MDQRKVVRQVADVQKSIVSIEDPRLFHEAFPAVFDLFFSSSVVACPCVQLALCVT